MMAQMVCNGTKAGDNGPEGGIPLTESHYYPHSDSIPGLAMVHYIQDNDVWPPKELVKAGGVVGGTAIYRHRETGVEHIVSPACDEATARLTRKYGADGMMFQHIARTCNPSMVEPKHRGGASWDKEYLTDNDKEYEMLDMIEYKTGRIVIYPTSQLHSAYIGAAAPYLTCDPATGRLAVSSFWKWE